MLDTPPSRLCSFFIAKIKSLSFMQSGGYYPRLEAIARIADYLDCSVDYLLGRTDKPEVNK